MTRCGLDARTVGADPRRDPRRWRRARTTATRPCGSIRSTGTPRSWPPTRRSTARRRRSSPACTATSRTSSPARRRSRAPRATSAPGLRFHYLPHRETARRANVDSAEYANIVLSFSRYYGAARRAGMRPPTELPLLRDWVRRVVAGYWTHGGYLNWDTGLSFSRWHQRKKIGLAQQALIGVAAERELQPGAAWGAWAKWMLDRGLLAYDALAAREHGIPSSAAYDVDQLPRSRSRRLPRGGPGRVQRDAGPAGRARAARLEPSARALRLRPGHGPAGGHHAGVQHGDRRGQPADDPVRRTRPRAPVRRRPGGRGERRRLGSRGVRPACARRPVDPVRGPPLRAGCHAAAADAGAARRARRRVRAARLRRAVPRPARGGRGRARRRAGDARATASRRGSSRRAGRCAPRVASPRRSRSRAGVAARESTPDCATARTVRLGSGPIAVAQVAWLHVFSARAGYRIVPLTASRGRSCGSSACARSPRIRIRAARSRCGCRAGAAPRSARG